jgi:hypothetical protein
MIEINVKELNSNKTTYITSNLTLKETKLSKKKTTTYKSQSPRNFAICFSMEEAKGENQVLKGERGNAVYE